MNSNTMKRALLAAAIAAMPMHAVMATSQTPNDQNSVASSDPANAPTIAQKRVVTRVEATDDAYEADNSALNKRDRDHAKALPTDQPNNQADIDTAAAVRAAIVEDDSLSMAAHNIKLVAANGQVVLRGPVKSMAEKEKVADIARKIAGVTSVENLLEIDPQ